ncbi:hypothetical protein [Arachidicoccus terrestris]|uniref:hypothetical protein n=1 Tax=Arachidicoccus terrestris TaxID=2875539 RepID=UPI001CC64F9F|nr:hypothetical protein [Arachidicoccus terrestris]UAY57026.1 hypothetical protein K9M52_08565 [Arachidicoccus terrestris]
MKYLLTALLLFDFVATNAQNKIDGNWKGTTESPNGAFEVNYTFKVVKDSLMGVVNTKFGELALENGKVNGKSFSYSISFNQTSINFTGVLVSDDKIVTKNERGETTLAKAKN